MDLKKFFDDENCFKLIERPMLWHPLDLPEFHESYTSNVINGTFSTQELLNLSKKHIDKYKKELREEAIDCFDTDLELFWFEFGVNIFKDREWIKRRIYSFSYSPFAYDEDKEEEYFHTNFIVSGKFKLYFYGDGKYERELF